MVIAKTVVLAAAALSCVAGNYEVTLYDSPGFQGESATISVYEWSCTNVGNWFNDRASSARWRFTYNRGGRIAFFEHNDCQGASRTWDTDPENFPNNFAVDGIDNMVSSMEFMTDPWDWVEGAAATKGSVATITGNTSDVAVGDQIF